MLRLLWQHCMVPLVLKRINQKNNCDIKRPVTELVFPPTSFCGFPKPLVSWISQCGSSDAIFQRVIFPFWIISVTFRRVLVCLPAYGISGDILIIGGRGGDYSLEIEVLTSASENNKCSTKNSFNTPWVQQQSHNCTSRLTSWACMQGSLIIPWLSF